jgi:hypothetical protein
MEGDDFSKLFSQPVDIQNFTQGAILFTDEFNGETITIFACDTEDGSFQPVKASTGGSEIQVAGVTNTWVALPDAIMSANYLKFEAGGVPAEVCSLAVVLKG